jgi:hypothetical protein
MTLKGYDTTLAIDDKKDEIAGVQAADGTAVRVCNIVMKQSIRLLWSPYL